METVSETIDCRIPMPCESCPLRRDQESARNKISFSAGGRIFIEEIDEVGGINLVETNGHRTEAMRENIKQCEGPTSFMVTKSSLLGRLGLSLTEVNECGAYKYDPTSRRQVNDYFSQEDRR
jgi:hypothetical protein